MKANIRIHRIATASMFVLLGWLLLIVSPIWAQEGAGSDEKAKFEAWKKDLVKKEEEIGKRLIKMPKGQAYEVEVPDTLDLAERARLGVNCLTGSLDPEYGYELYFVVRFCANPPFMSHEASGLPTNNPKFAESLPMMRLMSGSEQNQDIERGMLKRMLAMVGDDGLYYAPLIGRPWHQTWHKADEDFANIYGNARWLLALIALYEYDGNPLWKEYAEKAVKGLRSVARVEGDMAYFPDPQMGESFSFPKSGYPSNLPEPTDTWFGIHMYFSGVMRALAKWSEMTNDTETLEFTRKLCNFVRQPKMWMPEAQPASVAGQEMAHFTGHYHAHVAALRGLLEYAMVADDAGLKEFIRNGYEWARDFGIARIGWFPEYARPGNWCESCCIGDMVGLAVKLSDAGVGDYWEDVDRYTRNQLVEQQFVDKKLLEKCAQESPLHKANKPWETDDRVIERNIGGFAGHGGIFNLPNAWIMHCCTGNATQGLYYAWEGIVRDNGNKTAQINLLLNRSSPWLDIYSYLPYEGKVLIKNKTARRILARMPNWVSRKDVHCQVGKTKIDNQWFNNYLVIEEKLNKDTEVTIEFPIVEETFKSTLDGVRYAFDLRGNTVVGVKIDMEAKTRLQDGKLYIPGPRATHAIVKDVKIKDAKVTMQARRDAQAGIILRYQNADNYLLANYADGNIYFHEVIGGNYGSHNNTLKKTELGENLTFTAEVEGNEVTFTVTDGTKTYNTKHTIQNVILQKEGKVGLFHNVTGKQEFDNFCVADLQGQTVFEDQFNGPNGDPVGWKITVKGASVGNTGYVIYQRDHMRSNKAPVVKKKFYVLDRHIEG